MSSGTILEVKQKLNGDRHEFASALLAQGVAEVVSLYIVPGQGGNLGGVPLPTHTRCLGYFWTDRPYNVYHAVDASGQTLVFYVNISDQTTITADAIIWRDLIVDVVITPDGQCAVHDEDELPVDLAPDLYAAICAARDTVVSSHRTLVQELEVRTAALLAGAAAR
jgi:hypothetical protein